MSIRLISRSVSGAAGNADSGFVNPLIGLPNPNLDWPLASDGKPFSPDGSKVLFHSRATNLAAGTDTNASNDLFLADVVTGTVTRLTSTPAGNAPAGNPQLNDASYPATAMFALNGTKVLFTSKAPDLVAGEAAGSTIPDIYSYDIASATLSRVTTSTTGGGGNSDSRIVALSDDGTKMVFLSSASNLDAVPGASTNLWVHDLASGSNTRIGTNLLGFKGGVDFTSSAGGRIITADGSKVLFASGSELDAADTNGASDVFLFRTATGTSERITAGSVVPNGASRPVSVSADGQSVCFLSRATNLTSGTDTNSTSSFNGYDLFVKNMVTGAVTRLTSTAAGNAGNAEVYEILSVSPDGNRIAFTSIASDLGAGTDANGQLDVFVADIRSGQLVRATSNAAGNAASLSGTIAPSSYTQDGGFSADGSVYVFYSPATDIGGGSDTNNVTELFAYDFTTATLSRVGTTPAGNATASGTLGNVAATTQLLGMSNNGRKIVFGSTAADFVGNDSRGIYDLFVKDLDTGTVARITSRPDGSATAPQFAAEGFYSGFLQFFQGITDDGRYVYFTTSDTGLVPGSPKYSLSADLFRYDTATAKVTHVSVSSKGAAEFGGVGMMPPGAGVSSDTGSTFAFSPVNGSALFVSTQTGLTTDSNTYDLISDVYLYTPDAADPPPAPLSPTDGPDSLLGGVADESLSGLAGDDTLDGGPGRDTLDGGTGNDTADYSSRTAAVVVVLSGAVATSVTVAGLAEDTLLNIENLLGGSGDDVLTGDAANNRLVGAAGHDALSGAGGADTLDGGAGNDTILGGNDADTIDGGAGADSLLGGSGADSILGGTEADRIQGEAGNDTLLGGSDDDTIDGGDNADSILGGDGHDSLNGGTGADSIQGEAGNDTLNGADGDDRLYGGAGNDQLFAASGHDLVDGGEGDDLILAADALGKDTYIGGAGDDTISYSSALNPLTINLSTGKATGKDIGVDSLREIEIVIASDRNDVIRGSAARDVLIGGKGADRLTGGAGPDVFRYLTLADSLVKASGRDTITDFNGIGGDRIDLSALDADSLQAGDQRFNFIVAQPFSGVAGELRFASGVLTADVNGDKQGDFAIALAKVKTFDAAWLIP